ncbi:MAG: hypothetical protein COB20_13895 [SAR86 cluster bacterium]|uniref:Uncharacterized protein n=1 Tax=SAR86 cluster bacterium TaxID=2030880 RepID=A0A2A4WYX3_9GAMM|nr:MAG: hypothetical protein COB20_13895 [SAR86 cluster bacterium]
MVVNISPDGRAYSLGKINSTMHVYNTNNPPGRVTNYDITITSMFYRSVDVLPGHSDQYAPNDNAVYIQNNGPSKLQVLYVEELISPEDAGWKEVKKMPKKF